jgi:hypothetical protein
LNICRIGHSRLIHSYLLNNEERPECIMCNSNYSLKHVLIDCVDVADAVLFNAWNFNNKRISGVWILIYWLVFYANLSNSSAISWLEQILLLNVYTYKIHIVSIPMGTYCALFLADLFFMRMSYPDPLFTHHVINDVLSINISMCGDFVDHIYPKIYWIK